MQTACPVAQLAASTPADMMGIPQLSLMLRFVRSHMLAAQVVAERLLRELTREHVLFLAQLQAHDPPSPGTDALLSDFFQRVPLEQSAAWMSLCLLTHGGLAAAGRSFTP